MKKIILELSVEDVEWICHLIGIIQSKDECPKGTCKGCDHTRRVYSILSEELKKKG